MALMEDSQVSAECHSDWHKIKHAAEAAVHQQSQAGECFMCKDMNNDTGDIFPSLSDQVQISLILTREALLYYYS